MHTMMDVWLADADTWVQHLTYVCVYVFVSVYVCMHTKMDVWLADADTWVQHLMYVCMCVCVCMGICMYACLVTGTARKIVLRSMSDSLTLTHGYST